MSRRLLVRAIAFIVFALIISIAVSFQNINRTKKYEEVISNNYYYALSELMSSVTKIDYALEKCACSADDSMVASLCAEIFREADVSSRALSRLPLRELELEETMKFISKTGDYGYYLMKKAARGEEISGEEKERLYGLGEGSHKLLAEIRKASDKISAEDIDLANVDLSETDDVGAENIKELEREFSEYPVLVYDGPFSDETEGERELLKALSPVDEEEIMKNISKLLSLPYESIIKADERVEDGVELISFTARNYSIDATKRGGVVMRVISDTSAPSAKFTTEEALKKAGELLYKNGFSGFYQTYYTRSDNLLTVNFAKHIGETVVYPELIKLTISLHDGTLVNFDSAGYIKNYKERKVNDISNGIEKARERVSKDLEIISYSPAVIPSDGKGEILTHEFVCKTKEGKHCLVYINATTFREERILILLESENGTLVM